MPKRARKTLPRPKPEPAAEEPAGIHWSPLPPPRKNKPLLIVASLLVAAWIAALVYLVLRR